MGESRSSFLKLDVTSAVATQPLADQQDDAVDREEDRRGERLGEEDAQFVLQQEPDDPDGHRGDGEHEQQSVVRIGVGFVEVPERRDAGAAARPRNWRPSPRKSAIHVVR